MLELIRKNVRRGARNRLILSGIFFALSAWTCGLWYVQGAPRGSSQGEAVWVVRVAGALALIFLPFVVRAILVLIHPTWHPGARRHGSFADLEAFLASFHPDEPKAQPQKVGKVFFGRSILIEPGFGGLEVFPFAEIAWIYPKATTLKLHGLVPLGTVHDLCLAAFKGAWAIFPLEITDDEPKVAGLMEAVKQYAPWAKVGWDEEFARAFRTRRQVAVAPILQKRDEFLRKERQLEQG